MSARTTSHSQDSFRDPAGFIFKHEGTLYRQINQDGKDDFEHFMSSGLYEKAVKQKLIVSHKEADQVKGLWPDKKRYKIIQPDLIPFVSYPYEWSFSQLKDAALLTLKLQRLALQHGMILKDSSAYNVQFIGQQPIFIDTLSFKIYEEGSAWEGYKQFCEHFIAPLALAAYDTPEILPTLRVFLDGIPLNIAVKLLPNKARINRGLLAHIYLHAASQRRYDDKSTRPQKNVRKVSTLAMNGLLSSLERTLKKLTLPKSRTVWSHYYSDTNYSDSAFNAKKKLVEGLLDKVTPKPKSVWDLGANDGTFSEISARKNIYTVSFDIDPLAVEQNYINKRDGETSKYVLALTQNLANPSPSLGWAHGERSSLVKRGPTDVVLALALVHHLAIGNNTPLPAIASFFAELTDNLIIEFIPKSDSKVQLMLIGRANIFADYTPENFENAFNEYFKLVQKKPVQGSERVIYLYKAKA